MLGWFDICAGALYARRPYIQQSSARRKYLPWNNPTNRNVTALSAYKVAMSTIRRIFTMHAYLVLEMTTFPQECVAASTRCAPKMITGDGETSEIGDDRMAGTLKMIVAVKFGAKTLWRSCISRV